MPFVLMGTSPGCALHRGKYLTSVIPALVRLVNVRRPGRVAKRSLLIRGWVDFARSQRVFASLPKFFRPVISISARRGGFRGRLMGSFRFGCGPSSAWGRMAFRRLWDCEGGGGGGGGGRRGICRQSGWVKKGGVS